MHRISLFFFSFLFCCSVFGSIKDSLIVDSIEYKNYFESGIENKWDFNNDKVFKDFQKAIIIARKNNWIKREVRALIYLADMHLYRGNLESVVHTLELIDNKILNKIFWQNKSNQNLKIEYYELLIMYFFELGINYEKIIEYSKNIIEHLEEIKIENQSELHFIAYNYLADAFKEKGQYQIAENYLEKAYLIQNDKFSLLLLGDLSFRMKDIAKAKNYYNNLNQLILNKPKTYSNLLIYTYQGLANCYYEEENYSLAIEKIDSSLLFHSSNSYNLPTTYNIFGKIYLKKNNLKKARSYFQKAFDFELRNFDISVQGFKFYSYYLNLADAYLKQNNYEITFQKYQESFQLLNPKFDHLDSTKNPLPDLLDFPLENLEVFSRKIKAIRFQYDNHEQPESSAKWGLQTCKDAMQWMNKIFEDYTSEKDQQIFIDHSYSIFENAIYFAIALNEDDLAFEYSERSRSIVLNQALKRKESEIFNQSENPLVQQINRLQTNFQILENKKLDPNFYNNQNSIRDSIFSLKENIRKFKDSLIQAYPSFKNSLQNYKIINPVAIAQNLKSDQVLLEYFVGEREIYAFVIGEDGLEKIERISFSKELKEAIGQINDNIYFSQNNEYLKNGHLIFQRLINPLFPDELPSRMIIVPDGDLGYIPFNVLLTDTVDSTSYNFKKLPYLLKETSISLAFSATWQFKNRNLVHDFSNSKILAFAPAFKKLDLSEIEDERRENDEQTRSALDSLKHTFSEIQFLGENFSADLVMHESATKDSFLQIAQNYAILHLATHAKVDKYEPDFSFVAFSNLTKDYKDVSDHLFKLSLGEIYAQDFKNSKMVVLSACETGIGKSLKGEGIISIARGFAYTGIPSIITSLWNVNDRSTRKLMKQFYTKLGDGNEKDLALNNAFKNYLDNAVSNSECHPKKWAAFTVIGDLENIPIGSKNNLLFYLFVIGITVIVLFFLRSRFRS